MPGELSLVSDSLSLRIVELVGKSSATMLLLGVSVHFATVPFVGRAFATLGLGFAELEVRSAFSVRTVVEAVVGGDGRDVR